MNETATRTRPDTKVSLGENLTPREAAAFLNVPEATLAVWRSTNRVVMPFFKMGHHVRYRRTDLERFIEANMRGGTEGMQ